MRGARCFENRLKLSNWPTSTADIGRISLHVLGVTERGFENSLCCIQNKVNPGCLCIKVRWNNYLHHSTPQVGPIFTKWVSERWRQCWSTRTRTRTRVQLEYTRVLGPYSIKSTRKLDVLGPYSILCTRFLHVLERQVLGTRPQYSRPYSKS